jgi:hypothetical protein
MNQIQIVHDPKTLDDLFGLNILLQEKLDYFIEHKHPEMDYNMQMFIGEKEHKIILTLFEKNADRTSADDKEDGR